MECVRWSDSSIALLFGIGWRLNFGDRISRDRCRSLGWVADLKARRVASRASWASPHSIQAPRNHVEQQCATQG